MRKRILLVEDQEGLREGLADYLRLHGYAVDLFDSATRAVEFLSEGPKPDLILLDLMLTPEMTGWQFASTVKSNNRLKAIPVVAVSGASLNPGQLGRDLVDAFLPKPFELEKLLEVVGLFIPPTGASTYPT